MNKNSFSVNYEVYNVNTNETIDRKTMVVELTDRQIREMAKVMEDNGGYAPELSVFQHLYEYLIDQSFDHYEDYVPVDDDDFWEKNNIDLDEVLPNGLLKAAEKYVRFKDVNIIYYYEDGGVEKSGNALVHLPTATYWTMVEMAKTKTSESDDFAHLKDTSPHIFDEVRRLVAERAGDVTIFVLREFPYQILEKAMESI